MLRRRAALALLSLLASGCAAVKPSQPGGEAADPGRAFAQRACAGCHAIDAAGVSPNARAPAFRDLARQRSDEQLGGALAEISRNGHVEMPPIYITPEEMRQLTAYMRSLTARVT